jgi:hypothetical protein
VNASPAPESVLKARLLVMHANGQHQQLINALKAHTFPPNTHTPLQVEKTFLFLNIKIFNN